MSEWVLVRTGQRGNMHAAQQRQGKYRSLCGRIVGGKLTVWKHRAAVNAWYDGEARHCGGCEDRINADLLGH